MKKLIALVLTLALSLSVSVPAFAHHGGGRHHRGSYYHTAYNCGYYTGYCPYGHR